MRPALVAGGALAAVLIPVAGLVSGVVPGIFSTSGESARPPCSALPGRSLVEGALSAHAALASQIRAVGANVSLTVEQPCHDSTERALLLVTYSGDEQHQRLDGILSRSSGFGVPVQLKSN